ncbi:MAG: hypothetical protein LBQ74_15290 [Prevotella sp.]|jgi:hypothetical protein|nr:hypothetical protein [Prevotella sp.]
MTIREAIEDVKFTELLNARIQSYKNRPLPPSGKKYRRTPFDTLGESGLLTPESILKEYVSVREKRSRLSHSQRQGVVMMAQLAIGDVISYRKKEKKN